MSLPRRRFIFIALLLTVIISFYGYQKYRYKDIDEKAKFVVGEIISKNPAKNGFYYTTKYKYLGKIYTSSFGSVEYQFKVNNLVLIKVNKDDASIHKFMLEYLIPKDFDIRTVPDQGWLKIPDVFMYKRLI